LEHPGIKQAAVIGRQQPSHDMQLVAYCVPAAKPEPGVSELRAFLGERLPDYMIPSAIMILDMMPLTPTGKLDRNALPSPGRSRPKLDVPFVAPRTAAERQLAQIWAEVLALDQVGIHDNFLDLGGHSLMATQIVSRIITGLRVELAVKSMLDAPTVAEMAIVITQNEAQKAGEEGLNRMLDELETLSDYEAKQLLDEKAKDRARAIK
jgi:hypothetical protein